MEEPGPAIQLVSIQVLLRFAIRLVLLSVCAAFSRKGFAPVLNRDAYRDARIVVADRNFGCGSSREHAVWALYDFGIRAVMAPSFGDIFYNNSLQNGLLPVMLPAERVAVLRALLEQSPGSHVVIDLESKPRPDRMARSTGLT